MSTLPHPRRFYLGLSLFVMAIAFAGFWPTYFGPLLAGTVDKPTVIHFHAAIYVGWLAIFVAQTAFAATRRVGLHVTLGRFAIGYGVLVIAMGVTVAFSMFALRVRSGNIEQAQASLLGPLLDMAVFAPLFAAAIYYRRQPERHKRLMIVATTVLLIAAVARMPWLGTPRNPWLVQLVWWAPILLAMGYDYARQRAVHAIYLLGLVVTALESPTIRRLARETATWHDAGAWLATWVS